MKIIQILNRFQINLNSIYNEFAEQITQDENSGIIRAIN